MARFTALPMTQRLVAEWVNTYHRHLKASRGDIFRFGILMDGEVIGVCQVGRPVSRHLDNGSTVEVTRLCLIESERIKGAASFAYGKARRIARELGFLLTITYTLETEPGTSLVAAGRQRAGEAGGGSWSVPSRPRQTELPMCRKVRWEAR